MYHKSAQLYDNLYHFVDYSAATKKLINFICHHNPSAKTLLEVACGTGKYLEQLQNTYQVEGLDISPDMLHLARKRLPDVVFHESNMTRFELGKQFDVVACLFSSIGYVKTVERFYETIATLKKHVTPGGLLIIEPFFTPNSYWPDRVTLNIVEQHNLKVAWMYVSKRVEDVASLEIHYTVGTPQSISHFTELHEIGLFSELAYERSFAEHGLGLTFDHVGLIGRGLYIGTVGRQSDLLG